MAGNNFNAAGLAGIQIQHGRPITAHLPTVYRRLPVQFVDTFFSSGELRLSCFAQFKRHTNELQGDRREGETLLGINDVKADRSFFVFTETGKNAFILSTTVRTTALMDSVFGDASIEIFDPLIFAIEVANEIPGCIGTRMGWCIYVDNKILVSDQRGPEREELEIGNGSEQTDHQKIAGLTRKISGPRELFLKPIKHEAEAEFRFIWETNRQVDEPLIVTLQNLERFCRRGGDLG
ncbi:MAG: hypothetical protein Q7S93_03540 [Phenylobacterium sp.]|uniref:hypothetical protein n=1 Tax=Phenylobacterium sp. TaxID=1871053 RepID=UPI002722A472|nr:hypothetical protein [Phenylobacterium sp.]MDO8409120.1 hypothetical protein [Phenylobacterium sp.]